MRCLDPSVVLKKKKGPEWFGAYLAALGEKTGLAGAALWPAKEDVARQQQQAHARAASG